jgi:methylmalonyl-CoA epimerase
MSSGLSIDHIGVAVRDLEEARARFARLLGVDPSPVEELASEGVRVSFFSLGEARIELLAATREDSAVGRFLARRGEGVHHLALRAAGAPLEDVRARLAAAGLPLASDELRAGAYGSRVLFVHPKAASGVLVEFVEPGEPHDRGAAPKGGSR